MNFTNKTNIPYVEGTCILQEEYVDILRIVFNYVDKYDDYIVNREQLIKECKNDFNCKKILKIPAVRSQLTNKIFLVENILDLVQFQYQEASPAEKISLEYITWNQFYQFFTNFNQESYQKYKNSQFYQQQLKNKIQDDNENQEDINENPEIEIFDIDEQDLEILKDLFDMMPHTNKDFVNVEDYVISCKTDFQAASIKQNLARLQSLETNLPQEVIDQCIDRIAYEADEYCTWKELKCYFSSYKIWEEILELNRTDKRYLWEIMVDILYELKGRRGRPIDLEKQYQNQQNEVEEMQKTTNQNPLAYKKSEKLTKMQCLIFQESEECDMNSLFEDNLILTDFLDQLQNNLIKICKIDKKQIQVLSINKSKENQEQFQIGFQIQSSDLIQDRFLIEKETRYLKSYFPDIYLNYTQKTSYIKNLKYDKEQQLWDHITKENQEIQNYDEEIQEFNYKPFDIDQIKSIKSQLRKKEQEEQLQLNNQKKSIYGQVKKKDTKVTVPAAFNFEEREKQLRMTIKERKREELIKSIKQEEEKALNYKFKANKVPIQTKIPLYDNLMAKQQEKRIQVRENSKKITQENAKPFSFYERDMQKKQKKIQLVNEKVNYETKLLKTIQFKAKEPPITSKIELLPVLDKKKQKQREQNKKERKEQLEKEREEILRKKCPRMLDQEKEYKEKLQTRLTAKTHEQEEHCSHKPKITPYDFGNKEKSVSEKISERKSKGNSFMQTKQKPIHIPYLDEENKKPPKIIKVEYKCDYCNFKLKKVENVYNHEEGQESFICKICQKEGELDEEFMHCKCMEKQWKDAFDVCLPCYEKQDSRLQRDKLKRPKLEVSEPTRTLESLEEQFECVRQGKVYEPTQRKKMTSEEINLLNKLRRQKKEDEEAKKKLKEQEKKDKEKQKIAIINAENKEREKKEMQKLKEQREKKLANQPLNMQKKGHGSNILDQLRNKQSQQQNDDNENNDNNDDNENNNGNENNDENNDNNDENNDNNNENNDNNNGDENNDNNNENNDNNNGDENNDNNNGDQNNNNKEDQQETINKDDANDDNNQDENNEEDQKLKEQQKQEQEEKEKQERIKQKKIQEEQDEKDRLEQEAQEEKDRLEEEKFLKEQEEKENQKKQEKEKQLQLQKEQEEKLKKELEEKLKKEQEEQEEKERLEKEAQEEQDRLEEEKFLKEQEAKQQKKELEEKLKKEQEEKLKKEQEEKLKKEQEEKLKKEQEEKLKKEQEEQQKKEQEEKLKKEQEEKEKKEQEEKLKKEQEEKEQQQQFDEVDLDDEEDKQDKEKQQQEQENKKKQEERKPNSTIIPLISLQTKNKIINKQYENVWKNQKEQFTDTEFQPNEKSVCKNKKDFPASEKIHAWLRAKDCYNQEEIHIFFEKIEPADILQGSLGDCYFLSSLSVIAEHDKLIRRLFDQQQISQNGCYAVWLNHDGEWNEVVIDDYLPANERKQPIFSRGNGNEIWVQLLEKAYAKLYGSFEKIEGGLTVEAIRDLTGAPGISKKNDESKYLDTWEFIIKNNEKGYLLTAGSQQDDKGKEIAQTSGIISGHAYAILDAQELENPQGQKEKIIQLRNPWGASEWNGAWSDNSDKWTEKTKKQVNLTDKDDGIFWMPVKDFCSQYSEVSVNMLHEDYFYTSKRVKIQKNMQKITINFNKNTHGFFSITQKDKRNFIKEQKENDYQYSKINIVIYDEKNKQIIVDNSEIQRNCNVEINFKVNINYTVFYSVDWVQTFHNEIVLSLYSENQEINLEGIKNEEISDMKEYYQLIDDQILQTYKKQAEKQKDIDFIKVYSHKIAGFLYYLYENETENQAMSLNLDVSQNKYLNLIYQNHAESDKEIKLEIEPKKKIIVKFSIDPKGKGAYSYSVGMSYSTSMQLSDEDLLNQAKQDPKTKQANVCEKVDRYFYPHQDGLFIYYDNQNDSKTFYETLDLGLQGMEGVGFDGSKPYEVVVQPKSTLTLKCKITESRYGFQQGFSKQRLEGQDENNDDKKENKDKDDDDDEYGYDEDFDEEE